MEAVAAAAAAILSFSCCVRSSEDEEDCGEEERDEGMGDWMSADEADLFDVDAFIS
jgi:hypothetical protein